MLFHANICPNPCGVMVWSYSCRLFPNIFRCWYAGSLLFSVVHSYTCRYWVYGIKTYFGYAPRGYKILYYEFLASFLGNIFDQIFGYVFDQSFWRWHAVLQLLPRRNNTVLQVVQGQQISFYSSTGTRESKYTSAWNMFLPSSISCSLLYVSNAFLHPTRWIIFSASFSRILGQMFGEVFGWFFRCGFCLDFWWGFCQLAFFGRWQKINIAYTSIGTEHTVYWCMGTQTQRLTIWYQNYKKNTRLRFRYSMPVLNSTSTYFIFRVVCVWVHERET